VTVEVEVEVCNEKGIHAYPSSLIVRLASQFESDISLHNLKSRSSVDAKSILEVMMINAPCGTPLLITAVGADEEEAVQAVADLVQRGFDEKKD